MTITQPSLDDGTTAASTLYGVLVAAAEERPQHPLLVDGPRVHTCAEVLAAAEADARRLAGAGVGAGDRLVVWQPNGLRWVSTFFACMRLGAVAVLANTRLRLLDIAHIVGDSGAKAMVFSPRVGPVELDGVVDDLSQQWEQGAFPHLRHLLATGDTTCDRAELLHDLPTADAPVAADPNGAAVACFTSGSTGSPKGCLHSHATLIRNGSVATELLGLGPADRVLCPVPFSHVFGFHMGVLQATMSGATLINCEPYDAASMVRTAEREKATVAYAVPTMAREFAEQCNRASADIGSLRVMLIAGAPVGGGLRRTVASLKPGLGVSVVYGCTEAPTITQLLPGDQITEPDTAVGRPTPGVEVRIVEPGGTEEVPPGNVGEVVTRGYNRMLGYLGNPAATMARLRGEWFATGDLGFVDSSGVLHIVGRHSEMFLVGGFNAYPAEIAGQLEQMDQVAEAAVVAVPDERLGSVPMAWVVARAPGLDAAEVISWARLNMASFKRPRYVQMAEDLPRTSTKKVAFAELERMTRDALPELDWSEVVR